MQTKFTNSSCCPRVDLTSNLAEHYLLLRLLLNGKVSKPYRLAKPYRIVKPYRLVEPYKL